MRCAYLCAKIRQQFAALSRPKVKLRFLKQGRDLRANAGWSFRLAYKQVSVYRVGRDLLDSRQDHDRKMGMKSFDGAREIAPVQIGHDIVRHNQVDFVDAQKFERLQAGQGRDDRVSGLLQNATPQNERVIFVIYAENDGFMESQWLPELSVARSQ